MKEYPTPWQRKTMWAALTACFVVLLVVVVGAVIWTAANIVSFLQPILIPVAIAVILTYLLDPLVTKMSRGTLTRTKAVALVFAIAFFSLGGLAAWLIPPSQFKARILPGRFPRTLNGCETTQSISSIDSTTHSDYLAEGIENLHRQVLRTG